MARRWVGGASGGSDGGGNDFVVDSCVGTWKPGDAGQSREVLLDSHPGLFLTGADPSAVRRLFGTAVAEFFSDKRGWRVEAGAGALLVSCDVERLPAGWSADPLAGPIACDHLDEFLARATAIARLIRDEAAATVP